jgi:hypothetical protein
LLFDCLFCYFIYRALKFNKLLTVMENAFQLNEINDVDLGDDSLIADPTPGSGVSASTKCTPNEHVNLVSLFVVESEDGDRDVVVQFGARSGVGGEGGSATFQKKERQKTSKV